MPLRWIPVAYKDLIIRLSEESPHHFIASVMEDNKPVASNSFELRLDELRIMERLRELEEAAVKPDSKETFHIDFGQELYQKVLAGELGSYFQKQLDACGDANVDGLRISLQFDDNASGLAALPWEFLHDGQDFLVARRSILMSRLPSKLHRVQSPPLDSIIRMLVIISAPNDPSCAPLDIEKERDRILQAVDKLYVDRKIDVDFTDDATYETIQSYLNEKDYHIVHFTGHGRGIDGQGYLVLETEDNRARLVDNQLISDLFAGRGIRLVMLNACQSADLANKLVRRKISAVLAMQYSVVDESATRFAFAFYHALSSGKAIDLSLTEARLAMRNAEGSNKVDFATPVLYMLDPYCLDVGMIKPKHVGTEIINNMPKMLVAVQVMEDGFVGRQKELRILQRAFLSGVKRAAIVHGWGGIGKTVLATRLAKRMERHFEGVYAFKCLTNTRAEDILNGLGAFLTMAGIPDLNQILCQPVPMQVKIATLVNILNQRRFLIILDNFESCLDESKTQIADQELHAFIVRLLNATAANTKYLITTRYDFDPLEGRLVEAVEHLPIPEMPLYQAVWLMNNHTQMANLDIGKKKEIYRTIGGHPWTIGMFAWHASAQTVDGLLLELEPLKRELREFTLFDKSYSMLDDPSKELLLRASIFEEAVTIEALRWIMGDEKQPSPPVDQPLRNLMQWGLMARQEDREDALYSVHTMVSEFVWRGAKADRKLMLVRAAKYYELKVKANKDLWDHLRARDYYYRAGEWEKAAEIVIDATEYLHRRGYIELAMMLLQRSVETTSGAIKAMAEGDLAIIYNNVGDWKMASELLAKVVKFFEDNRDLGNACSALLQMGIIHQHQGRYAEAIKLYQHTLDISKELDDKFGIANSLGQLGNANYHQGNYYDAINLIQQSLNLSKELNILPNIAKAQHELGNIYFIQCNYYEAVKLYQQSLNLFNELGDISGIANCLGQLGNVNYQQGNYYEAIKLYQQSLDLYKKLGYKSSIAKSLGLLGNVHYRQGNYPNAIVLYQQSLDLFKDLDDKSGITKTLHQLGIINQHQGKYSEAIKLYEQSLDINKELGDKAGMANSLGQLGNVRYHQGSYYEAIKLYQQSLDLSKELNDISGVATNLHQLGMIHSDHGNFSQAIMLYQQSLDIKRDLGDKLGIANSLHELGNVYFHQGNYSEAINLYQQSLDMSENLGHKFGIASSLHQLGRINEESQELESALEKYLQAYSIFEELGSPSREIAKSSLTELRYKMGEETFEKALDRIKRSL